MEPGAVATVQSGETESSKWQLVSVPEAHTWLRSEGQLALDTLTKSGDPIDFPSASWSIEQVASNRSVLQALAALLEERPWLTLYITGRQRSLSPNVTSETRDTQTGRMLTEDFANLPCMPQQSAFYATARVLAVHGVLQQLRVSNKMHLFVFDATVDQTNQKEVMFTTRVLDGARPVEGVAVADNTEWHESIFALENLHSGQALNMADGTGDGRAAAQQCTRVKNSPAFWWRFEPAPSDSLESIYILRNVPSGKLLSVHGLGSDAEVCVQETGDGYLPFFHWKLAMAAAQKEVVKEVRIEVEKIEDVPAEVIEAVEVWIDSSPRLSTRLNSVSSLLCSQLLQPWCSLSSATATDALSVSRCACRYRCQWRRLSRTLWRCRRRRMLRSWWRW